MNERCHVQGKVGNLTNCDRQRVGLSLVIVLVFQLNRIAMPLWHDRLLIERVVFRAHRIMLFAL